MFIRYYKGSPNAYVIAYRGGRVVEEGVGLSFFYSPFSTTLVVVPVVTQDVPFIFQETTANFQDVAVQGHLTYRFDDPAKVAALLDFSLDLHTGHYKTDDPEKLQQRIIHPVQTHTRAGIGTLQLEEALVQVPRLTAETLDKLRTEDALAQLGVVIESLYITSIAATPEMKKALEADYREGLQRRADQAIYQRRAAAVAEERKIRQSEMDADIGLEQRRQELVDLQAQNNLTLAEAEAKADEMKLNPYAALPPQALLGLALKEWAAQPSAIGQLNITPDLLSQLAGWMSRDAS